MGWCQHPALHLGTLHVRALGELRALQKAFWEVLSAFVNPSSAWYGFICGAIFLPAGTACYLVSPKELLRGQQVFKACSTNYEQAGQTRKVGCFLSVTCLRC